MPYIITTHADAALPRCEAAADRPECAPRYLVPLSPRWKRRGARAAYERSAADSGRPLQRSDRPESGGTVGPLPDGTVIEVRRTRTR
jgi:hypothetical protein